MDLEWFWINLLFLMAIIVTIIIIVVGLIF